MYGVCQKLFLVQRRLHLHTLSRDGPTVSLKRTVAELGKMRKRTNAKKGELFVEVPESKSFLDTATMLVVLTVAAIALFAKLLLMCDDSKSQEMIERKIKNAPPSQGTIRMLSREEWEEFREVRPGTPFESKLARPNAQIRTGEQLRMEDLKDWTIDVLTNALTRAEDSVRHYSKWFHLKMIFPYHPLFDQWSITLRKILKILLPDVRNQIGFCIWKICANGVVQH